MGSPWFNLIAGMEDAMQKSYDVYLGNRHIDTVFWVENSDAIEVKASLINHDGYDPRIVVVRTSDPHDGSGRKRVIERA